jgi:hypothetical protein
MFTYLYNNTTLKLNKPKITSPQKTTTYVKVHEAHFNEYGNCISDLSNLLFNI